jgi:predicted TIM-barrel fold metal-dependent hydrolase
VAGLRIGYGALIAAMSRMMGHLSPGDHDRFFWKNAKAFYRL